MAKRPPNCCNAPEAKEALAKILCRTTLLEEQVDILEKKFMGDPYASDLLDGRPKPKSGESGTERCNAIMRQILEHRGEMQRLLMLLCSDKRTCLIGEGCHGTQSPEEIKKKMLERKRDLERTERAMTKGKCPRCLQIAGKKQAQGQNLMDEADDEDEASDKSGKKKWMKKFLKKSSGVGGDRPKPMRCCFPPRKVCVPTAYQSCTRGTIDNA